MTYTEQEITIVTDTGPQTVKAWVADNGLAYHTTFGYQATHITWSRQGERETTPVSCYFTVTHVASGYAVCKQARHFILPGQCKAFIERIDNLTDWKCVTPVLSRKQQISILVGMEVAA